MNILSRPRADQRAVFKHLKIQSGSELRKRACINLVTENSPDFLLKVVWHHPLLHL